MQSVSSQHIQLLIGVEFFKGVNEEELRDILSHAFIKTYEKDASLFFQGDPASAFYVIVEGRVKLTQLNEEGEQIIHHYPGVGEAFGIIAVLRQVDYPVAAQAVGKTKLLMWTEKASKRILFEHPQLGLNSIRLLSKYIIDFQDRIKELSTERVERRIARTLLRIADQGGKKVDDGIKIDWKLTRQDIAEMSGTTLYSVSRIISQWERDGVVDCSASLILIKKHHHLMEIAETKGKQKK